MPNIDDFKSKLIGGGARANLFEVTLNWCPSSSATEIADASFLIKATSLPASTIGEIDLPYRGRMLKIAGDRTYDKWSVTVINDNNMSIRTRMEEWINYINNNVANVTSALSPLDYYRTLSVVQLDRKENKGKRYDFEGAYPTSISAIELGYDKVNEIEDFTVEFAYQYFTTSYGAAQ